MKKLCLPILLCLFSFQFISAQGTADKLFSHKEKDILIGAGFNAVYDTGLRGPKAGEGTSWNFANPFYVSGEYYLHNNYSIFSILSLNKYNEGKYIDGYFISENSSANFIAFDVAGKYTFRELLKWYTIEPYAFTGFGVNSIGEYRIDSDPAIIGPIVEAETRVNYIIGAGTSYWFSPYWAINLNVTYKIGLGSDIGDQLQPSLGVVYKLTN